jgi:integrase
MPNALAHAIQDHPIFPGPEVSIRHHPGYGIAPFGLNRMRHVRRTCAKLCRKSGGDLEQIKFLLGHSSIQTTERYLGSDQEVAVAVNDNLAI